MAKVSTWVWPQEDINRTLTTGQLVISLAAQEKLLAFLFSASVFWVVSPSLVWSFCFLSMNASCSRRECLPLQLLMSQALALHFGVKWVEDRHWKHNFLLLAVFSLSSAPSCLNSLHTYTLCFWPHTQQSWSGRSSLFFCSSTSVLKLLAGVCFPFFEYSWGGFGRLVYPSYTGSFDSLPL